MLTRWGKTKITAMALVISFIFIGTEGERSKANYTQEEIYYRWPVFDSTKISEYYDEYHKGIDIVSESKDSKVVAARGGVVIAARSTDCIHLDNYPNNCCNSGMGNYVKIQHDDGTYASYSHLKYDSVTVTEGQRVETGTVLGIMGSSGRSKGIHLHFQVGYSSTNTINTNPDALQYTYPIEMETAQPTKEDLWEISADPGVNMRKGAGTDCEKIAFIPYQEQVTIEETVNKDGGEWGKTAYAGAVGWISLKYVNSVSTKSDETVKKRYMLVLDPCGGNVSVTSYEYGAGAVITNLPIPKRDGYKFMGWFDNKEGGVKINPRNTINEDMTVYAMWSKPSDEGS